MAEARQWLLGSALLLALAFGRAAAAEKIYDPGASDSEIKIGQTMPYSGPLSSASVMAKVELAYFRRLNKQGGINGRRIALISLDDGYSPPKTVEQTRRLVEQEEVLAMMGSFGSSTNAAVQKYLTARKVPQLFLLAGSSRWNDPAHFPWTMALVPPIRNEGKAHASYVLRRNPTARIAVLYQDDDYGRDYLEGVKERFGPEAAQRIAATASYLPTDPTVDSQIITLEASGADTLFLAATPKFTAQALRKAFDLGWHPLRFITLVSTSVGGVLEPAGLERTAGVMSAATFKSVSDPQWQGDLEYRDWLAFMHEDYPEGDVSDQLAVNGYAYAALFAEILRRCGDDLTRAHLMEVATHLDAVHLPMLLPGISVNTSPTDFNPLKQIRLQRFDGREWRLLENFVEQ